MAEAVCFALDLSVVSRSAAPDAAAMTAFSIRCVAREPKRRGPANAVCPGGARWVGFATTDPLVRFGSKFAPRRLPSCNSGSQMPGTHEQGSIVKSRLPRRHVDGRKRWSSNFTSEIAGTAEFADRFMHVSGQLHTAGGDGDRILWREDGQRGTNVHASSHRRSRAGESAWPRDSPKQAGSCGSRHR